MKTLYKSCMDQEQREKKSVKPLMSLLKKSGGWPVLEGASWSKLQFSWYQQVLKLKENGLYSNLLIDISVSTDLKNSSWRTIQLDQSTLGLSREFLVLGVEEPVVQVSSQAASSLTVHYVHSGSSIASLFYIFIINHFRLTLPS